MVILIVIATDIMMKIVKFTEDQLRKGKQSPVSIPRKYRNREKCPLKCDHLSPLSLLRGRQVAKPAPDSQLWGQ